MTFDYSLAGAVSLGLLFYLTRAAVARTILSAADPALELLLADVATSSLLIAFILPLLRKKDLSVPTMTVIGSLQIILFCVIVVALANRSAGT